MRKQYPAAFKVKVVLEVIKGDLTMPQISSKYGVHQSVIFRWKKAVLEGMADILGQKRQGVDRDKEVLIAELYRQIGQLKVELDWLKKSLDLSIEEKRGMIEPGNEQISIGRQCDLIGLPRSSYYYESQYNEYNQLLMRLIDEDDETSVLRHP